MDNKYIVDYYTNKYDENSRFDSKYASVEFLTTMRYIDRYIKKGDRVLEIGAATGRYSHALAQQGYTVDAVELVEHNIEIFKQNTLPNEDITVTKGNALNLSMFLDNTFDITLLLGPLYHLYTDEDKKQAIREAIRVTKKGGVIFAAYVISDSCILDEGFHRGIINVADYIKRGIFDPVTFDTTSHPEDLFELARKEDVDRIMSDFKVTRLHYVASDGYSRCMREVVDAMDEETFNIYLNYHYATCEREDLLGISSHSLDIMRKDI